MTNRRPRASLKLSDRVARARRRLAPVLRQLVIGVLALALLVRPTLDSLSELHEFAKSAMGDTAATAWQQDKATAPGSAQTQHYPSSPFHLAFAVAHCCGWAMAALPAPSLTLAPRLRAAVPVRGDRGVPLAAELSPPFRPPITA